MAHCIFALAGTQHPTQHPASHATPARPHPSSRLQGFVNIDECSLLCQVEIGCIGWTHNRILRSCTIGYQISNLPPLRDANVVYGRPAQV